MSGDLPKGNLYLELIFEPEQEIEAMLLLQFASGLSTGKTRQGWLSALFFQEIQQARDQSPEAQDGLCGHQLIIQVRFRKEDCGVCPVQSICTRSKLGIRHLLLLPQAQYEALQKARQEQQTPPFGRSMQKEQGLRELSLKEFVPWIYGSHATLV